MTHDDYLAHVRKILTQIEADEDVHPAVKRARQEFPEVRERILQEGRDRAWFRRHRRDLPDVLQDPVHISEVL